MAGGHSVPWGPLPRCVSPSLPIEAGYQEVVAAANPNQACSTAALGTWTLLHGVKVTLPARESWGCRQVPAGGTPPAGTCLHPQLSIPSPPLRSYLLRLRAASGLIEP